MSILIFSIVLSALVIVHELGHFSVAKYFGIRVDEFGLGYPPRAKKLFSWRGTDFTLNWLPFGGFVKIFGENPAESDLAVSPPSDSFQHKNRGIQAAVLFAGVFFNFLFAWLLISLGFLSGIPAPESLGLPLNDPQTVIRLVIPDSPADLAGFMEGDVVLGISRGDPNLFTESTKVRSPEEAIAFISASDGSLNFTIRRGKDYYDLITVKPTEGILPDRLAVGVAMENVGTVKLSLYEAIREGLKITWRLTTDIAEALGTFIWQAAMGKADLKAVTGPVGLVGMVGEATGLGFGYLLTFTAIISLNLSLINLLPFPALDGGRLVFVGIESIIRRPISPRIFNMLNTVGFLLLIFLMIIITIRDVRNIL